MPYPVPVGISEELLVLDNMCGMNSKREPPNQND
jgi:hypothetical protein